METFFQRTQGGVSGISDSLYHTMKVESGKHLAQDVFGSESLNVSQI